MSSSGSAAGFDLVAKNRSTNRFGNQLDSSSEFPKDSLDVAAEDSDMSVLERGSLRLERRDSVTAEGIDFPEAVANDLADS